MPENKLQYYAELAEQTAQQLTYSLENWTAFLDTAARLYKYPYHEQLMIYAQRPDATACADYDTWNKTMRRYIRRGTKGIALIDHDSDTPKLKYVYDLADTGTRQNSRPVNLWRMEQEHMDSVFYTLEQNYGVTDISLHNIFEEIAANLADEFWDNHRRDIIGIVDDSFLEEYTDGTIGVRFREAVTVSTTYTIMSRCRMDSHFTHEDFLPVFEFNTPDTIAALGTAVSQISEQVLRDIEITIKIYEKERIQRDEERTDLHQRGGLRLPEPDPAEPAAEVPGQVREDASGISEEPQTDPVQQIDPVREAALPPDGDRGNSERSAGTDDGRAGEEGGRDGADESIEPDAVGADDEQPEIPGRGNDPDGTDLQLSEPFSRGNQLSLFDLIPTEAKQIESIDKAESEPKTPFAFSFSQEEIDTVLRFGSNTDDHRKRIVAEFMKQKSLDENADFLKRMYHGGNGFIVDNRDICAWYADDGIHLTQGRSARYTTFAKVLDWEEAAERVGQMLEDGTFASNVELAEAVSHAQRLLAVDIWNLHSYFSESANGKYYSSVMFDGTYPDSVDRITEMLADPFMRDVIAEETVRLATDYTQNRDLLRFHHARPDHLAVQIQELEEMTHEYATDMANLPAVRQFITEDEIAESFIGHGSGVHNSKFRIYDYLTAQHTDKEKIDFLKNEYGTGGHSHALSGSTGSWEDHDSKGVRLKKSGCADVEMSWTNVLKRVQDLIYKDRYLTQEEKDTVLSRYAESTEETVEIPENPAEEPAETSESERIPETVAVYPAEENHLPYDVVIQTIRTDEPKEIPPENFRITDDDLGTGGAKAKFRMNMDAINTLKQIESEKRHATPEEQEILSKYVGWGGLADAFDDSKENWKSEYAELSAALTPEEYTAARSSTLNAHYTSPTVIKAIYEVVGNMGFQTGNILEPAMGVGNFFGLLPEEMSGSKLYGVELDSITGRIAKQLYPNADITVAGFETTDRRDFFDLAVGNVPFGNYKVNDRAYNKLGFSIHDYFFAKTLDQVRPGGVIAFVTSRYTMDKQSPEVRKYIAERADLLGAIRLPNNAFKKNAGTEVTTDILFLQKRDRPQVIEPDWVHLGQTPDGITVNSYFVEHPEMVLGTLKLDDMMYGDKKEVTCEPLPDVSLADLLHEAVKHIGGQYKEAELPDLGDNETIDKTLPADPDVKNYSYTVVDGEVYYRENSIMVQPNLNATAQERVKGMVELRDCVHDLIDKQLYGAGEIEIVQIQNRLNQLYDDFSAKYGLINDRPNRAAFAEDSSYYLLCSLEILDEDHKLKRKADMFTKRTIMPNTVVTSVDTAAEALAVSIAEKAKVDMPYMSELTGKSADELAADLRGVIFQIPEPAKSDGSVRYVTADEYLSGNVREKLRIAEAYAADNPAFAVNVEALTAAQPKKLEAHEIDVRLGATWIDKEYIQQFMMELLNPAFYHRRKISVNYSEVTAEWNIMGKSVDANNINSYHVYGTDRINAYRVLEDTLNLRDVRIYDTVTDSDGKERRVLNSKETTLAQQKQQAIKDAFQDWTWKDSDRRHTLVDRYNELFNSSKPREYNGEHIRFNGMNPEISLREHQKNAVAHIIYGGNTLLAHEVGAGKTFEMVAAAMESKRLGLCNKPLFAVPNHLTEQWASEFLRLYPSANILVTTKKDFEPANRKKFCARIATGNYDAVIMGHSQFEKIPMSKERQEQLLQAQIEEITEGIEELESSNAERFTIKQLERTKKSLESRLSKLQDDTRKDDVITFEQLGVDRLYVDEAHSFKNCFLYTKMRNVAGLSTTDSQKSSDMLMKCRYLDEITGSKGVVFATGTPVSNSMTELYTMMRYLQHDTLVQKGLSHFDAWASTFGETSTAIELAPEGTGYRARTRFAKFFNLPELMNLFKEAADIKTADQLHLPTPTAIFHNVVAEPTEVQLAMMEELSERASKVHSGTVDPSIDNMLSITSDGRKLGLDQRIINPNLPDDPMSKVNLCVDNIFTIWQENMAEKLTQLVFCDLSTPKGKTGEKVSDKAVDAEVHGIVGTSDNNIPDEKPFTVYEDIRDKLIARGVPAAEIAFIHDADTEVKKKELFAKVRSGQVRVLLGSTSKMGAGTNVQDRLIALHDLDAPWRPGDLQQRAGRIVRQGNMNPEVHIYRYVTEKSFDSYLWQTLENKQKFISQIMTSKSPVRTCDDVDETALSYAEVKALCAGDDRIREKMNLDVDVAKLKVLKADHQSKQHRLEDDIQIRYPAKIEAAETAIAGLKKDHTTAESHPHPVDGFAGMKIKVNHFVEKDTAGEALLSVMKEVQGLEPLKIGTYRGFDMSLTLEDFGKQYILTLKGEISHRVELGKDVRGNLIRMDNALGNIPGRIQAAEVQLASIREQLETAKTEVGKPFPQEEELKTKNARLIELNAELDIEKQAKTAPVEEKAEKPSILARLQSQKSQPAASNPKKNLKKEEVL